VNELNPPRDRRAGWIAAELKRVRNYLDEKELFCLKKAVLFTQWAAL
jgi:hypothetical protein